MKSKKPRQPEENQEYNGINGDETYLVIYYDPIKKRVTYRNNGNQYNKSLVQFSKLIAKYEKTKT